MVIGAIGSIEVAQKGPIKNATRAAEALLVTAAILIEANPGYLGAAGLEKAATASCRDLGAYIDQLHAHTNKYGQSILLALTTPETKTGWESQR